MKFGSKLSGLLLIAGGIALGVVDQFVLGIICVLVGIVVYCSAEPGSKSGKAAARAPGRKQAVVRAQDTTGAPAADAYAFRGSVEDYFHQILINHFANYTLRRNVALAELPGMGSASEISSSRIHFVLYQNGAPKAAILLIPKNVWSRNDTVQMQDACAGAGIPCLTFYNEFRNEAGYVIGRIESALR